MAQFIVAKVGGVEGIGGHQAQYVDRKDYIKSVFTDLETAKRKATERAIAEPGQQFAVMSIAHIFETGKPVIIEKTLNDAGEIVLKPKEAV